MENQLLLEKFDDYRSENPFDFLYDTIFKALRWAIITEKIASGFLLKEGELAALFQVSRTPVARALSLLKSQGLVVNQEKGSYVVLAPDYKAMRDIMEFRSTLEPPMAHSASKNATPEDLRQLRQLLQDFKSLSQYVDDRDAYINGVFSAESAFHLKLCEMCKNPFLKKAYMDNLAQVLRSIYFVNRYSLKNSTEEFNPSEIYDIHATIYYSVKVKNGRMAMDAVYSHLRRIDIREVDYNLLSHDSDPSTGS